MLTVVDSKNNTGGLPSNYYNVVGALLSANDPLSVLTQWA